MIDPIGIKPQGVSERRLPQASSVAAVEGASRAGKPEASVVAETGLTQLARELAAKPPVDQERVEQIRKAIADGSFPIIPAKIADRLIAAQYEWISE